MRALRVAAAAAIIAAACRPSAPRPQPVAYEGIIDASVGMAFTAAISAVSQEGLPLRLTDRDRALVETEYFDLVPYLPTSRNYPASEREVRFRILATADTLGRGVMVGIQALYLPFRTGGIYSERNERAIPRGHPGHELVRRVFRRIEELAGR